MKFQMRYSYKNVISSSMKVIPPPPPPQKEMLVFRITNLDNILHNLSSDTFLSVPFMIEVNISAN